MISLKCLNQPISPPPTPPSKLRRQRPGLLSRQRPRPLPYRSHRRIAVLPRVRMPAMPGFFGRGQIEYALIHRSPVWATAARGAGNTVRFKSPCIGGSSRGCRWSIDYASRPMPGPALRRTSAGRPQCSQERPPDSTPGRGVPQMSELRLLLSPGSPPCGIAELRADRDRGGRPGNGPPPRRR